MTSSSSDDPTRPITPADIAKPLVHETGIDDVPVGEPDDEKEAEEREGTDPA